MITKTISSVTVFNSALGMRMSSTYSEIDDETGRIISDNKRFDRVVTDKEAIAHAQALLDYATDSIPE